MAAGDFKAKCLAVMDEVNSNGEPVLITKHGKPVAKLVRPHETESRDSIFGFMKNKMIVQGDPSDLIGPIIPAEDWSEEWEPRP